MMKLNFGFGKEWKEIKKDKEEWAEVVAMDRAIRHQERHKDKFKNSKEVIEAYLGVDE